MKSTALQFRPDEDLSVALQRLAANQRQAAEKWARRTDRPAEAVHRIRLALKFLRALLKLSRTATGLHFYRQENARLQKAARALSPWRDATVIAHTVKKVGRKLSDKHRRILRAALAKSKDRQNPAHRQELNSVMQNAVASIKLTEAMLSRMALKSNDWITIEQGLKRSYLHVSHTLKRIQSSDTDESFHERRKVTKYLFYHLTLLEAVRPQRLGCLLRQLKQLQELLGKDHDVVVVRELLQKTTTGTVKGLTRLAKRLQHTNRLMRREIKELATETFSKQQKPGRFTEKLNHRFRAWREQKPASEKT